MPFPPTLKLALKKRLTCETDNRRSTSANMEWTSYLTYPTVVAAIAVVALTRIAWQVTQNVLFSPIPASVPGPLAARLTSKWILLVDLSGSRARTVNALHKRYGPVVRVAPNELSFSSIDCVKPIYGAGTTCIKSSAYDNFGRLGSFQMQDPEQHRQRQKRVAHIFGPASLQQMEPLIQSVIDRVVSAIGKRVGNPVDALHWCRMTALDVSGKSNRGVLAVMLIFALSHSYLLFGVP